MSDDEHSGLDICATVAERKIAEAMEAGAFDNLPGRGKPLVLDDDSLAPQAQRAANRILRNAGALPTWASLEQEIDAARARANDIGARTPDASDPGAVRAARASYDDAMRRTNDLILRYTLATRFVHRSPVPFRIKDRLAAWDARVGNAGSAP